MISSCSFERKFIGAASMLCLAETAFCSTSKSELTSSAPRFLLSSSFRLLIRSSYFYELRINCKSSSLPSRRPDLLLAPPTFRGSLGSLGAGISATFEGLRAMPEETYLVRSTISARLFSRFSLLMSMFSSISFFFRSAACYFSASFSSCNFSRYSIS